MPERPLSEAFLRACPPGIAATLAGDGDLESILSGHVAAAREAHPRSRLEAIDFVVHVAGRMQGDVDAMKCLRGLHAADLYLAKACADGDRHALEGLESALGLLPALVARAARHAPLDEVFQTLRAKLLLAEPPARPKILEYSGRGPLGAWLRVAAIRTALSLARRANAAPVEAVTRDVLLAVPGMADDPETAHLRERFRTEFKEAFEEAVRSLTDEQRLVLRLNLIDGLSIDEIGAIHQVHRATAARWIQKNLELVHQRTRDNLAARLSVSTGDLDSMMALVRSSLEISIQRLLGDEEMADVADRNE